MGWSKSAAPAGTPKAVVDTLNATVNAALADPAMRARFVDLGCDVFTGSPSDFGKFIADETAKWAKVVQFAHMKPQ